MANWIKNINETFNSIVFASTVKQDMLFVEELEKMVAENLQEVYQSDEIRMTPKGFTQLHRNVNRLLGVATRHNQAMKERSASKTAYPEESQSQRMHPHRIADLLTAAGVGARVHYPSGRPGIGTGYVQVADKDRMGNPVWYNVDDVESGVPMNAVGDEARRMGQASADVTREQMLNARRRQAVDTAFSSGDMRQLPKVMPVPDAAIDKDLGKRAAALGGTEMPSEIIVRHEKVPNERKYRQSNFYDIRRQPPEGF